MEIEKLIGWNLWWDNPKSAEDLSGIPRLKTALIETTIETREIVILTGVRRAGKSTIMYQIINNLLKRGVDPVQILFVNLDDPKLNDDSLDDIYDSYKKNINPDKKSYVFLDEIQNKENWESWLKKYYDMKENCKFVISGSSSYLLKKEYSTFLTGRNFTFEIFPLNFKEYLFFKNAEIPDNLRLIAKNTKNKLSMHLKDYMRYGGFPEAALKTVELKNRLLEQYFTDILYKDIVARFSLNGLKTKDLAIYLMTNFTEIISLRSIRGALGLSYDSTKDYLSYFIEAFFFFRVDHFSYSFKEQKTLPSKIYCIDNGLRNAASFKFSKDYGKLAENLVLIELKRRTKDVYYWKDKNEVDFVVKEKDDSLIALNTTYTDDVNEREPKGLLDFKKHFAKCKEAIIITKDLEKKEKGIKYVPLWKWLLEKE